MSLATFIRRDWQRTKELNEWARLNVEDLRTLFWLLVVIAVIGVLLLGEIVLFALSPAWGIVVPLVFLVPVVMVALFPDF